jgi:DNA polymerase III subunit epsilon
MSLRLPCDWCHCRLFHADGEWGLRARVAGEADSEWEQAVKQQFPHTPTTARYFRWLGFKCWEGHVNFVVLDVETANPDLSSICQIGVATFKNGAINNEWQSLINPQDEFHAINTSIHGIDEDAVKNAPTWADVFPVVSSLLRDSIVVSHTPFDRVAVTRACERYKLEWCSCRWLDSARVVRRAWPTFSQSGYGLSNVAAHFCIQYREHDALEDARCAGEIMLRAIAETGLSAEEWLNRVEQPIGGLGAQEIRRNGNADGPLFGEVLVFTGTLSMPRRTAADAAADAGCRVDSGVTKHTTLLVVGDEDVRKLAGHDTSSKHRKAEKLIAKGQPIRILAESDFRRVVLRSNAAVGGR